jgi:hypothetical protein
MTIGPHLTGASAVWPPRGTPARFVARRLLPITLVSILAITAGSSAPSDRFEPIRTADAATMASDTVMVSVFVPLACTVSTGPAGAPGLPPPAFTGLRSAFRPPAAAPAPVIVSTTVAGAAAAPAGQAGTVTVSVSGTPASVTGVALSLCSDGSTPTVNVAQSSGVISASSLTTSSTGQSSGREVRISDISLDASQRRFRVVTVIY